MSKSYSCNHVQIKVKISWEVQARVESDNWVDSHAVE